MDEQKNNLDTENSEQFNQLSNQLTEQIAEIYKLLKLPNAIEAMQTPTKEMLRIMNCYARNNFTQSEQWKNLEDAVIHLDKILEQKRKEWELIEPFLLEEIKKPEYNGKSIYKLECQGMDENGSIIKDSLWNKALTAATAAMKQSEQIINDLPAWSIKGITSNDIEETARLLPSLQSVIPKSHTMPNNSLMNTLQQKPAINAGAFDMIVSKETKNRKEITAYTIINYESEDSEIASTNNKLSEYERQVSDAIISLWEQAKTDNLLPVFTIDMIFRAMPGSGKNASTQQREAITQTIEKLRRLHIFIDATEEMQKRGIIKDNEEFTLDSFYLTATQAKYRIKNGGQTISAYLIESEPIVLRYAKKTKQIITIPSEYIAIKKVKKGIISSESITMSSDRQAMSGYLIRQIGWMKHDINSKATNPRSNIILFDTLFKETDTHTENRMQLGRNKDFIFSVLDYEVAVGYICGYEKQMKGRSVTGIKIFF